MNEPIGMPSEIALSFVACISNDTVLDGNLLASPCLQPGSPHGVILVKNCSCAAEGLNLGIDRARHEKVVCVHQDACLPAGWDLRLFRQLGIAETQFGPIGVAGVYGVGAPTELHRDPPNTGVASVDESTSHSNSPQFTVNRIGRVVHRGHALFDGRTLPASVSTLDELLLVLPRDTPLRFDPALGFHFYGADICLQAEERGLTVVVVDAPCHHNTRTIALPEAFFRSSGIFARKWSDRLPVAISCVVIDKRRRVWVLGSAQRGHCGDVQEKSDPTGAAAPLGEEPQSAD
jgi:hypothetical protein